MSEDTALYTKRLSKEPTDDGDFLVTVTVRAMGFAGARAYNADHTVREYIDTWKSEGGGALIGTYHYVIDGTEVAIEARNDAWAREQDARERDEAARRGEYWT